MGGWDHVDLASDQQELLIGVDFAGPATAARQRRKIVAVEANRVEPRRYRVGRDGANARLFGPGPPGWTAEELAKDLLARRRRVVAFDFPFSIPYQLLAD